MGCRHCKHQFSPLCHQCQPPSVFTRYLPCQSPWLDKAMSREDNSSRICFCILILCWARLEVRTHDTCCLISPLQPSGGVVCIIILVLRDKRGQRWLSDLLKVTGWPLTGSVGVDPPPALSCSQASTLWKHIGAEKGSRTGIPQ